MLPLRTGTAPGRSAMTSPNGNQLAALTLHGLFSHVPQTRQGKDLTQIEAVDLSSIHVRADVVHGGPADQRH